MAVQRYISTSFWDDEWVQSVEPYERYLYLYLLTNPLTNLAGVYKIMDRRISFDTGIPQEKVAAAMERFAKAGKAVRIGEYIVIPHWPNHQQTGSFRVKLGLERILMALPEEVLVRLPSMGYAYPVEGLCKVLGYPIDTISTPYRYPADTEGIGGHTEEGEQEPGREGSEKEGDGEKKESVSPETEKSMTLFPSAPKPGTDDRGTGKDERIGEIIAYLNARTGKRFKASTPATRKHVRARLNEGYSIDDFKAVIDVKAEQWMNDPAMSQYLRPETLFGTKFEGYLNERAGGAASGGVAEENSPLGYNNGVCPHCGGQLDARNRCPSCGSYWVRDVDGGWTECKDEDKEVAE